MWIEYPLMRHCPKNNNKYHFIKTAPKSAVFLLTQFKKKQFLKTKQTNSFIEIFIFKLAKKELYLEYYKNSQMQLFFVASITIYYIFESFNLYKTE